MSGDLYLVLHIEEKIGIQRKGLNLHSKVNVDYTEAILGTVIKVILDMFPCFGDLFNASNNNQVVKKIFYKI